MQLPKPAAVLCGDDARARVVLKICERMRLRVPEELAVMGIGDDETYSTIFWPPLSSVRLPAEKVGYEAARLIEGLIRGRKPPAGPLLFPPEHIVTRQSTDIFSTDDRLVAEAMAFIRRHAVDGIGLKDLLAEFPMTRQTFQRRFKKAVGRTPYQEILRVRIEHAKTMLTETDDSVQTVALASGFSDPVRMKLVFKKLTGTPPGRFRRLHRTRGQAGR